ncbi:hypothetical protein L3073_15875 [Ancylomarina sp. DW003]|nr:hypothetical protein [Ancylomarina sp. DW003]MDE5423698.1 hypothetical protein [Ancylomarina sp. DW003]
MAVITKDPVIDKQGEAVINNTQQCTWIGANGTRSTYAFSNPSRTDILIFQVNGAPEDAMLGDGKLNGQHTMQPNQPTATLRGSSDIKGQRITITNLSDPNADCKIKIS